MTIENKKINQDLINQGFEFNIHKNNSNVTYVYENDEIVIHEKFNKDNLIKRNCYFDGEKIKISREQLKNIKVGNKPKKLTISERKITELMFDIWQKSNELKNPVIVSDYIKKELNKIK